MFKEHTCWLEHGRLVVSTPFTSPPAGATAPFVYKDGAGTCGTGSATALFTNGSGASLTATCGPPSGRECGGGGQPNECVWTVPMPAEPCSADAATEDSPPPAVVKSLLAPELLPPPSVVPKAQCLLPGGEACESLPICPGSESTYSISDTSSGGEGSKRGDVTIFTTATGDVVVTASTSCNCYLQVDSPSANSISLLSNGNTTTCPASAAAQTDPGFGPLATIGPVSLHSCMSWVLSSKRVAEAAASSDEPGSVVITMALQLRCYDTCSSFSTDKLVATVGGAPEQDSRCSSTPLKGVVYRPPKECTPPEQSQPLVLDPPAAMVMLPPGASKVPPFLPPTTLPLPLAPPDISASVPPPAVPELPPANCSSSPGGDPSHCSTCSGVACLKTVCESGDVAVRAGPAY